MESEYVFAAQPETSRGLPCHVSCDPSRIFLVYSNGSCVFARNIYHPNECYIYSGHICRVQAVRCCTGSNNRTLIASADGKSNLHTLEVNIVEDGVIDEKGMREGIERFKQLSALRPALANINDLAWSSDGKRIAIGGKGCERFGHVLTTDSGNSLADIIGITREVRSVDFRSCKPMRVVFGCDDGSVCIFNGPPFKFARRIELSTKSINCSRFSDNGHHLAIGSSDGRVTILDGESGDNLTELGQPAHKRSVMSVGWSPKADRLVSVGTDGIVNVWLLADPLKPILSHSFNTNGKMEIENQQLGCVWMNDSIVSLSLMGTLSIFNASDLSISRFIKGHQNAVSALAYSDGHVISGGVDGVISIRDRSRQTVATLDAHQNKVLKIAVANKWILSCGLDDRLVFFSASQGKLLSGVKLSDQPVGCATSDQGLSIIACRTCLIKFEGTIQIETHATPCEICSMSVSSDFEQLVCGTEDNEIIVYSTDCLSSPLRVVQLKYKAILLAHSPDCKYLSAAVDQSNSVICFRLPGFDPIDNGFWTHHAAQVTSLSWSPNGRYLATSSVDSHVTLHDTQDFSRFHQCRNAHCRSPVLATCWPIDGVLYSGGSDSCIRQWKVTF